MVSRSLAEVLDKGERLLHEWCRPPADPSRTVPLPPPIPPTFSTPKPATSLDTTITSTQYREEFFNSIPGVPLSQPHQSSQMSPPRRKPYQSVHQNGSTSPTAVRVELRVGNAGSPNGFRQGADGASRVASLGKDVRRVRGYHLREVEEAACEVVANVRIGQGCAEGGAVLRGAEGGADVLSSLQTHLQALEEDATHRVSALHSLQERQRHTSALIQQQQEEILRLRSLLERRDRQDR